MISYVECLGGEGAGPGGAAHCWKPSPDEERDKLLPHKMAALQPKTDGSLRRRLLKAKMYQRHDAVWGLNAGSPSGMGMSPGERKPLLPHGQCPGNNPWFLHQQFPLRPHSHVFLEPDRKLVFTPETHKKPLPLAPPFQMSRSTCPILTQQRRTTLCPVTPEPRRGYSLPLTSISASPPPLKERKQLPQYHWWSTGRSIFSFTHHNVKHLKQEATQSSPLIQKALSFSLSGDRDSKWSVHYSTQTSHQRLLFLPRKTRSGSAEDLKGYSGLTNHDHYSRQPLPHDPACSDFSGLNQSEGRTGRRWKDQSRKFASTSSEDDEKFIWNKMRPLTPLVLNPVHLTSCWDVTDLTAGPLVAMESEAPPPRLPTPEERMRQHADAVTADVVPINITGESFDRQASCRRGVTNTDTLTQPSCNLNRCTTITGMPDDVSKKMDLASVFLPGLFRALGQPTSPSLLQQKTPEVKRREKGGVRKEVDLSARRIRAPKGEGISSLMASLTTSPRISCSSCSPSLELSTPSHVDTESFMSSGSSSNSISCRMVNYSSPSFQDLQGFPSDLQPLLPSDPNCRITPHSLQSSSSCFPSSPVTSSPSGNPGCVLQSDQSYPSDTSLDEAVRSLSSPSSPRCLSSSSIAESQFSYQVLDDDELWSYNTLSPSSSVHISQRGSSWSCKPLISSSSSSPSHTACSSRCSGDLASVILNKRPVSTTYSSYSHIFSLRKSMHPPPPPLRSDSLRQHSDGSKPYCYSSSSLQDCSTQKAVSSVSQSVQDPWVLRNESKRCQSGFNCGTVTTFEPLSPKCQAVALVNSGGSKPCQDTRSQDSNESSSFEEEPQLAMLSLSGFASPSSGYSSQSNSPTQGTPLTSPLPTSPETSSLSLTLCLSDPSLLRVTSRVNARVKPPVPQRKSSLLSSSFSSTSSLSSCASLESSAKHPPAPPRPEYFPLLPVLNESVLPAAPLPESFLSSPSFNKLSFVPSLPPPPPPPPLAPHLPPSSLPVPSSLPPSYRSPPPHCSCTTSTLTSASSPPPPRSAPALLSEFSELPTTVPPSPAPAAHTCPASSPLSSVLDKPPTLLQSATPLCPLVTAQALQQVKLRSVKTQEGLLTSMMLTNAVSTEPTDQSTAGTSANANQDLPVKESRIENTVLSSVDGSANMDVKLRGPVAEVLIADLGLNEFNGVRFHSPTRTNVTEPRPEFYHDNYFLVKHEAVMATNESASFQSLEGIMAHQERSGSQTVCHKTTPGRRREEFDWCVLLKKSQSSSHEMVNVPVGTDDNHMITQYPPLTQQISHTASEDTKESEAFGKNIGPASEESSSYLSLSDKNEEAVKSKETKTLSDSRDQIETEKDHSEILSPAEDKSTAYIDFKEFKSVFESGTPEKNIPPKRPVPPKKPDLCILGFTTSCKTQPGQGGLTSSGQMSSPEIIGPSSDCSLLILHKKPDRSSIVSKSVSQPFKRKLGTSRNLELSGTSWTEYTTGSCTISAACGTPGIMGNVQASCPPGLSVTASDAMGHMGRVSVSGALRTSPTSEISGPHRGSSNYTGTTQPYHASVTRSELQAEEKMLNKRIMRSSLAEDEKDNEEGVEESESKRTMMTSSTKKNDKVQKGRRRNRQLLMASLPNEPFPSSSSLTSSSGDEENVEKAGVHGKEKVLEVSEEDSCQSGGSCDLIGQSKFSLRGALSAESLQGEFLLPELLIEEREEEEKRTQKHIKEAAESSADLFISVSAEQMFSQTSRQPRSTKELFIAIHRSKRKMLLRKDSEEGKHHVPLCPLRTVKPSCSLFQPLRGQRLGRTESFKALLLRKGRWSAASSRVSAVERLCKVAALSAGTSPEVQSAPSPSTTRPNANHTSSSCTSDMHDVMAHMTVDVLVPPCSPAVSVEFGWTQADSLIRTSSSIQPGSLVPPCLANRRFGARRHLMATTMTAILEGEEGSSQRAVGTSYQMSQRSPSISTRMSDNFSAPEELLKVFLKDS
ncbi:uncharacterized protein LOC117520308 [Thalassophryne amazonica]|uniref:uncharacterized protein LOC117520308 n=1 Tax=Thalassophryne amazonica TaxID=390379 RepID=UPI0014723B50|nr:uncharacterized protein LOC117520308 [Thalassophryne amazonica]